MSYEDIRKQLVQQVSYDDKKSEGYNQIRQQLAGRFGLNPDYEKAKLQYAKQQQAPTYSFDNYLKSLSANTQKATDAYNQYKKNMYSAAPVFDESLAGYATDELAIEQLRTNPTTKYDKDELARLYGEMKKAQDAEKEANLFRQYSTNLQKFGGSSDKMFADYDERLQALKQQYTANPGKWRETNRQIKALEQERDALKDYNNSLKKSEENAALIEAWTQGHGGNYSSYKVAQTRYDQLDQRVQRLQNQLMSASGNDYSGYAVDEMSAGVLDNQKDTTASRKKLQAELEQAIRERDQAKTILQYAEAHQADDLSKEPDYELRSDAGKTKFEQFKQEQQTELANVRANPYADPFADFTEYYNPQYFSDFREPDERWTEEEKKNFYYLFDKNREQAYSYGVRIDGKYNAGEAEQRALRAEEYATRNFGTGFAASAASVPANLIGGTIDYARMLGETMQRGEAYETRYKGMSLWADTTRGAIAQKLNESGTISNDVPVLGGKGLGDLYQLMMSMADSSVAVMGGGGPANAIFFGSAAASTTRDALNRGLSGKKAVALGFAAGAAEVLGETLSIEHLLSQDDIADYLRNGLLKSMIKQGGVEASEEVLTTLLNTVADAVINGDMSEMQQNIYVNVANGMSYDEAVRAASKKWIEDLGADALGGFLSGGLMSGGRMALQGGIAAATTYKGDAQGLIQMAGATEEGSKARKLAGRYQQTLDKKGSINKLQQAKLEENIRQDVSAADRPALIKAAEARLRDQSTMTRGSADYTRMAENIVDKALSGERASFSSALEQNVYNELVTQIKGEKVTTGNWMDTSGLRSTQAREIAEQRLKSVEVKSSGERATIKSASMVDGKLTFKIDENGTVKDVTQDDLKLDDYQKNALETLTQVLGEDAAYAYNAMSAGLAVYGDAFDIQNYATSFALLRDLYGYGAEDQQKAEAAALASDLRKGLTDAQVLRAIGIGMQHAKEGGKTEERAKSKRGTGHVSLDGGVVDGKTYKAVTDKATVKRSKQYRAVKAIAKALGINVVLFESEANKAGKLTGAQGVYKDGVIYLDWYAGMNDLNAVGDRMLLRTMSHELTHFIQQNAPEEYKELRSFVSSYLANKMGKNFTVLVQQKMVGREGIDYDGAMDEVVADACETMLRDSQAVQDLMREHRGLWQTIRDFVMDFVKSITAKDDGAIYMQDAIDDLRAIWDKGLRTAVESRPTEIGDVDLADLKAAKDTNGKQLFQVRAFEHDEPQYREMLEKWGGMSSSEIDELFHTVDVAMAKIMKNLEALDYAWEEDIDDRGFQAIKQNSDKLYKVSLDFSTLCRKRLLQGLIAGQLSAALQRGLSKEEGIAVRDALLAIQAEGKQIEVACALCYVESARMRSQKAIQEFLNDREAALRNYYANQHGREAVAKAEMEERQAIYNELREADKAAGKPRSEWGLVRGKGDDATMYDIRDTKKAKMSKIPTAMKKRIQDAKKAARKGYDLTAEQQATLDYANSLPVEAFTTPEGLQDLAKSKYRDVFNAFVLKVSAASKSKGIENDTWWRAGDSQAIGDLLIQQMNAENGLRTQSWSDFTVKHLMDYIAATIELSTRGAKQHAYTKVLDYVDLMGNTGLMINMSLIPARDYNGKLEYDDVEGINYKEALKMREKFPDTAGTICIGITVDQVHKLLESMEIDYVIPYHSSGMSKDTRKLMHIPAWENFQDYQSEKKLSASAARENARKYGVELLSESDPLWHQGPSYSEWFDLEKAKATAKRVGKTGKYGVMTGGYAAMQEAAENYKRICAQRGLAPKFSYGSAAFNADFSNDEGYWKLLIDRKMVNNKTGEIIEQRALKPIFKFETVERILNDELKRYGRVKADQDEAIQRVTRAFLTGDVKAGMSSDEIAKVMQKPVDNIPITNITQNAAQMSVRPRTAEEVEAEAEEMSDARTQYSVRQSPPPKKTMIGYKVFMVDKKHPGQLYPTKVKNPGGQGTPVGVWLDADTGEIARNPDGSIATNTVGRISVKANGGTLAWRPGWHLGSLPEANQMNRADPKNPNSNNSNRGTTGLMWDNYVFCECEFAADEDYQLEAFEFGTDEKGSYKHTQAGLPYIPKDGYYKYRTNPDPSTAPWFISGSIRITKILDDDMRREIIEKWNAEHPDQQMRFTERYSRKPINLKEYGLKAGPVTPTEDLSSVAPGVDYSDEIKNLPGYTRHALNFNDPRVQEAFRIQQIEDKKDYYIDKYNREHREELENGSKKAARAQLANRNTDYYVTGDLDVDTDRAYAAATPLQDKMNDIVRGISEELGTKYEASTQKSKKSIKNKIIRKHDEGRTGYTVLDMKDHARSKVYVNEWSEIPEVLAYLRREGIQYETEAIGPTPYGYKGFHVTWRSNDGLGSELQITMPHVWQVKLISDGIYDKWRDIKPEDKDAKTARKFEADLARSQKMWEELQLPDFTRWDTSSSESTRPDISVPRYTGVSGADHLLSTSSLYGNEDMSNTRPSSVSTNMRTPPSHNSTDIISQEAGDSKYPSSKMSMRSDTAKTDRELLKDVYQSMLKDKQKLIDQYGKQAQEDLETYQKQAEDFRAKEKEVYDGLQELDRLVREGTDPDAVKKQREKVTAAEVRMTTALKKLSKLQERPALQKILQYEREIARARARDKIRESLTRKELRGRIDKLWKDLNRRITSPTEKKNIPVPVMQQAIDVLQAINMDTSRENSRAGEKLRSRLAELRTRYNELQNDPDYRQAAMYDAQVAEFLDNMIAEVGDTPINRMSNQQLEAVYNTLQALDYTARRALKLKLGEQERTAYEISKEMTQEIRSTPKTHKRLLDAWINAQLSPERMFNRLGGYHKNSTWSQVYRMLDDGQLKQTQLMMEGSMIFEDLLDSKEYEKFIDGKNTVDIGLKDLDGNAVQITHGMMVSLWMHLQNEQNRRHVAYGGLTIPGLKEYYNGKKAKGSENAIRVGGVLQEIAGINDRLHETEDPDEIAELEQQRDEAAIRAEDYLQELQEAIEQKMTDYDRQWIAACRELFDGFSKRVLNETTLEVYGIKRARVENYFPIWVDGNFLNTPFESVSKDMSLENAGFMKERIDSSKPIRLADVSDVTASQIRKVAQYAGLMPVIRNFNKIWGKTQTGYRDSIQSAVEQIYGNSGLKYIENLMADLNGARGMDNSPLGEMLNRMRGRMAQASLTLSMRTALGQTASFPTAASVVGWSALHKALWRGGKNGTLISRADQELIKKWSPLLYYRMKGYANTELGDIAGMNDKLSRVWKKARWATGWIQAMDGATVGRLWYAAEYYVQDHNKALVKGTDAYYEEVAKVFNDIVEKTQPNYSTMQRPDILRNPNALVKQLTMFLTQRLQNFNILYDACATYSTMKSDFQARRNGVTAEDVRQAGMQARTAAISQVAAAATIAAFKFLADVILHSMNNYRDDDKELTAESISLELLDMFLDSLAGSVLGGSEVYDIIESKVFGKTYYGIEVSGVSTVTDLIDTANKVFDHVAKGEASLKDLDNLAKKLGPVAGIPYANAKKIISGGVYWIQDIAAGEAFSFEAGVDRTTAQQAHRLYRAYQDMDYAKVKKIRGEVPEDKQKDLDEAVRKYIKDQYKAGDISFYDAERQLQKYGNASDQVMQNFIKEQFKDGKITQKEAENQLVKYGGMSAEQAKKSMMKFAAKEETGLNYNDIDDMFKLGEIDRNEAKAALVKYGLSADTASMKVEYWEYTNKHPGSYYTTEDRFETYYKKYKPLGFTASMYEDFKVKWDAVPGVDNNNDGKADSGSKKKDRILLIDALPLSNAQKDELFNMEWKTGLEKTPWHK